MAYATVQNIRDKAITESQASDAEIQTSLDVASELIDGFCRRSFGLTSTGTSRKCDGRGHGSIYFESNYLDTLQDIKVDGISVFSGLQYVNYGQFLQATDYVFPSGYGNVEVIGRWGKYSAIPKTVEQATITLSQDILIPSRREDARITEKQVGDTRVRMAVSLTVGMANKIATTGNPDVDDWLRPLVRRTVGIGTPNGDAPITFSRLWNYGRIW